MILKLTRVAESVGGTTGVLSHLGVSFAVTLEQAWQANQPDISCIPPGVYTCNAIVSPHMGPTYEVTNVPGRTHILFHRGNTVEDTHGCILVAEEFGGTFATPVIVDSQRGFSELMSLVSAFSTFQIDIVDATKLTNESA